MSTMELCVFMNKTEVIRTYRIPKHLQKDLFADMPIATMEKGRPVYLESQVDAFLQGRFPYHPAPAPYQKVQGARPRGGRKATTDDVAEYALSLKVKGMTLKEIASACRRKWPDRPDTLKNDAVRKTMSRYEERQARKSEEDLGINPMRPR